MCGGDGGGRTTTTTTTTRRLHLQAAEGLRWMMMGLRWHLRRRFLALRFASALMPLRRCEGEMKVMVKKARHQKSSSSDLTPSRPVRSTPGLPSPPRQPDTVQTTRWQSRRQDKIAIQTNESRTQQRFLYSLLLSPAMSVAATLRLEILPVAPLRGEEGGQEVTVTVSSSAPSLARPASTHLGIDSTIHTLSGILNLLNSPCNPS